MEPLKQEEEKREPNFLQRLEARFIAWLESLTPRQQHLSVQSMSYWLRVEHKRKMEGRDA